jgi:hypothetical protein
MLHFVTLLAKLRLIFILPKLFFGGDILGRHAAGLDGQISGGVGNCFPVSEMAGLAGVGWMVDWPGSDGW